MHSQKWKKKGKKSWILRSGCLILRSCRILKSSFKSKERWLSLNLPCLLTRSWKMLSSMRNFEHKADLITERLASKIGPLLQRIPSTGARGSHAPFHSWLNQQDSSELMEKKRRIRKTKGSTNCKKQRAFPSLGGGPKIEFKLAGADDDVVDGDED